MNKFTNQNKKLFLIFVDILTINLSFITAFLLRFDFNIPESFFYQLLPLLLFLIFLQITTFYFSGLYNIIWRFTSLWDMINIIKGITITNLIGLSILGLIKGPSGYPRSVLLMFFILNILMICFTRIVVRLYHTHYQNSRKRINHDKKKLIFINNIY